MADELTPQQHLDAAEEELRLVDANLVPGQRRMGVISMHLFKADWHLLKAKAALLREEIHDAQMRHRSAHD